MTTPATQPDTPLVTPGPSVFLSNMFGALSMSAGINKMVGDITQAWLALGSTNGASGSRLPNLRFNDGAGLGLADVFARPNEAGNPRFTWWTQATSVTADGIAADDWYVSKGTGGSPAFTVSRQAQTLGDVDGGGPYFLRFAQSALASSTAPFLEKRLTDVRRRANQKITISVRAKCSSGTVVCTPRASQNFGSGGSPSSTVNTDGSTFTVTTSLAWYTRTITVPAITGKTIGSTADTSYLAAQVRFPLSATYTVDVYEVKVERGEVATDFQDFDRQWGTNDLAANAVTQADATSTGAADSTTSTTFVDMASMSRTLTTVGGPVLVIAVGAFTHSGATVSSQVGLQVDAVATVSGPAVHSSPTIGASVLWANFNLFTGLAAGSHTFKSRWLTGAGTITAYGGRGILALELRR